MPGTHHLLLLAGAGLFLIFGHFFIFMAYRVGPTGVVAPFYYCFTVWAVISGLVVFGQFPNMLAIGGIASRLGQRGLRGQRRLLRLPRHRDRHPQRHRLPGRRRPRRASPSTATARCASTTRPPPTADQLVEGRCLADALVRPGAGGGRRGSSTASTTSRSTPTSATTRSRATSRAPRSAWSRPTTCCSSSSTAGARLQPRGSG